MQVEIFELGRVQSLWKNRVEVNLTQSGVHPYTLAELLDEAELEALGDVRLGYGQTNGSVEANFVAVWSSLDAGDEIIYMVPNSLQNRGISRAFGVTVRPLALRAELAWQPDLDQLDPLVLPRTRVISLCNPNSPPGMTLSQEAMRAIVTAAEQSGVALRRRGLLERRARRPRHNELLGALSMGRDHRGAFQSLRAVRVASRLAGGIGNFRRDCPGAHGLHQHRPRHTQRAGGAPRGCASSNPC